MRKTTAFLLILSGMVLGGMLTAAMLSALAQDQRSTSKPTLEQMLDSLDTTPSSQSRVDVGRFQFVYHPLAVKDSFIVDTAARRCWQLCVDGTKGDLTFFSEIPFEDLRAGR